MTKDKESSQSTPVSGTATEGSTARTTDAQPSPLTPDQMQAGVSEARRIINNAAGYYFGGELTAFAPEFKSLALRAIEQLSTEVVRLTKELEAERRVGMRLAPGKLPEPEWDY